MLSPALSVEHSCASVLRGGVKALELAAVSGVDRACISNYENGLKTPGHLITARLVRALGYRPSVVHLAHEFAFGLEEYEIEEWRKP